MNCLVANGQFLQIELHQVLKICGQILFGKIGEKFRLGAFVDLTNAVYQLPFVHTRHPSKSVNPAPDGLVKIPRQPSQYRQSKCFFFSVPSAGQCNAP
jgi:hypothetical protein